MNTPFHEWGVIYALEKLGALSPEWAEKVRQLEAKGGTGGQTFEQFQTAQRGPKGPDPFAAMRPRQKAVARVLDKYPMTGGWGDRYVEGLSQPMQKRVRLGFDVPHRELVIDSKQKARRLHDTMFRELGSKSPEALYPKYTEQMFHTDKANRLQEAYKAQQAHQAHQALQNAARGGKSQLRRFLVQRAWGDVNARPSAAFDRPGKPGTPVQMRQDPYGGASEKRVDWKRTRTAKAPRGTAVTATEPAVKGTAATATVPTPAPTMATRVEAGAAYAPTVAKSVPKAPIGRAAKGLQALKLLRAFARAKGV